MREEAMKVELKFLKKIPYFSSLEEKNFEVKPSFLISNLIRTNVTKMIIKKR